MWIPLFSPWNHLPLLQSVSYPLSLSSFWSRLCWLVVRLTATSSRDLVFACIWFGSVIAVPGRLRISGPLDFPEIHWIPVPLSSRLCALWSIQLMTKRNRKGDNMHPRLVSVLTSNASVSPPPWITLHLERLYWHTIILISFSGMPWCLRIFHKVSLSSVDTVKCLLKVDVVDVQWRIPFSWLLNNDLVTTWPVLPESCWFFPLLTICFLQSL